MRNFQSRNSKNESEQVKDTLKYVVYYENIRERLIGRLTRMFP